MGNMKIFGRSPVEFLIICFVALCVVDALGIYNVPVLPFESALQEEGVAPPGKEDSTVLDPVQVYVKVNCYEGVNADQAGLAGTASDQAIRIYTPDGQFVEQVTTSSGTATLSKMYWSGTELLVQARQGDVASADPYVSPAVTRFVPHSSSLEASDTVSIDPIYVRDCTGTAPTLKVWDATGAAISDNSANYLNTTDNLFTVQMSAIDDDTYYGPEDFTDLKTGRKYDGGLFFVWKGTVTQSFEGYKYHWSDPTNVYYVWEAANFIVDDTTVSTDDIISIQIATSGAAALVADSTVVLDCHDIIWLEAVLSSSDLIDGGAVGVTAITTKVA
jgi:hypothetical protein